jgi:hypothetical protein
LLGRSELKIRGGGQGREERERKGDPEWALSLKKINI